VSNEYVMQLQGNSRFSFTCYELLFLSRIYSSS